MLDWLYLAIGLVVMVVFLVLILIAVLSPLVVLWETIRLSPRKLFRWRTWLRYSLTTMMVVTAAAASTLALIGLPDSTHVGELAVYAAVFAGLTVVCTILVLFVQSAFGREPRMRETYQDPLADIDVVIEIPETAPSTASDAWSDDTPPENPPRRKKRRWWTRRWRNRYRQIGLGGKSHEVPLERRDEEDA